MTADPPAHPVYPKKPARSRATGLIGALAGILLALLASELVRAGYFQRWEKFAAPHPHAVEILWGDEQNVQVRIAQGFTLLWLAENSIWIKSEPNTEPPRQPCSSVPAAFNPLAGAPFKRVDCAVFEYPRGDMITTVIYALDKWGVIWQWERTMGSPDFLVLPFIALTGGFLGLLAAGIIEAIGNRRRSHAAKDGDLSPEKNPRELTPGRYSRKITGTGGTGGTGGADRAGGRNRALTVRIASRIPPGTGCHIVPHRPGVLPGMFFGRAVCTCTPWHLHPGQVYRRCGAGGTPTASMTSGTFSEQMCAVGVRQA